MPGAGAVRKFYTRHSLGQNLPVILARDAPVRQSTAEPSVEQHVYVTGFAAKVNFFDLHGTKTSCLRQTQ